MRSTTSHLFLERALLATRGHPCVAVLARDVAASVRVRDDGTIVVTNDEPARGMTHALRLGLAAYRDAAGVDLLELVVLLVDLPLVDAALVGDVIRARGDADVAFPERAGRPGHPVVFGARAIAMVDALPEGDSLRRLRDDPRLRKRPVRIDDDRPYRDIDTPEAYAALLHDATFERLACDAGH